MFSKESLEKVLDLKKAKIRGNNLMCCCIFHKENKPSFGINLENGLYNCFSCGEKGNILYILTKKLNRPVNEVLKYLKIIPIDNKFSFVKPNNAIVDFNYYTKYSYLKKYRYIHKSTLKMYDIRVNEKYIIIPVRNTLGKILGIKKRSKIGKYFVTEGNIKSTTIFGIDKVMNNDKVYVFESEFDGIYGRELGYNSVALMGCFMSNIQAGILSGFNKVILCFDSDKSGECGLKRSLDTFLNIEFYIKKFNFSKDLLDMDKDRAKEWFKKSKEIYKSCYLIRGKNV